MKCLLCYKPLTTGEVDYHAKCVTKVFGTKNVPLLEIDESNLSNYTQQIAEANNAITGVQPKLSLWLEGSRKEIRFTILDNKSNYIIKPQSEVYLSLPENEDLCMHLAKESGITVATHGLIRSASGQLAYFTKRFDRNGTHKIASEDLCQLTESLTEHKYRGSYEKTGKTVRKFSTQSGLDALNFYQLVLFSFITGNADMHLKNFSMYEKETGTFCLSPAYDLVSTFLVIKNESEQMSLTINGKKNKLSRKDFDVLGSSLQLNSKQIQNCHQSFTKKLQKICWWIDNSFLPVEHKESFKKLVLERITLLNS